MLVVDCLCGFSRRKGLFEGFADLGGSEARMMGGKGAASGSDIDIAGISSRRGCRNCLVSLLACLLPGKSSSRNPLDLPLSIDDLGVAFSLPLKPVLRMSGGSICDPSTLRLVSSSWSFTGKGFSAASSFLTDRLPGLPDMALKDCGTSTRWFRLRLRWEGGLGEGSGVTISSEGGVNEAGSWAGRDEEDTGMKEPAGVGLRKTMLNQARMLYNTVTEKVRVISRIPAWL